MESSHVPEPVKVPPLTADEAALIQESIVLDRLIAAAVPGDSDIPELQRIRDGVLTAIRDSRRKTWDAWILSGIEDREFANITYPRGA